MGLKKRIGRPPKPPELTIGEPHHERREFADRLQAIIDAVEIGDLSKDVRLFLQKKLRRHDLLRSVDAKRFPAKGEEQVTVLLRTVFESSNGAAALTVPVLRAVSNCMETRWVDQGLAWIEFFDSVGLVGLLEQIRALDFCDESDLEGHLRAAIRRRLVRRFGPPKIAVPKKPPARPKTARPPGGIRAKLERGYSPPQEAAEVGADGGISRKMSVSQSLTDRPRPGRTRLTGRKDIPGNSA